MPEPERLSRCPMPLLRRHLPRALALVLLTITLAIGEDTQLYATASDIDLFTHIKALMEAQERRFHDRIGALENSVQQSLAAAEKAILKAEVATEKRLEGLNELRAVTEDRSKAFAPRDVVEARLSQITTQIDDLRSRLDRIEGSSSGMEASWGYIVGGIAVVIAIITMVIKLRQDSAPVIHPVEYRSIAPPPAPPPAPPTSQ